MKDIDKRKINELMSDVFMQFSFMFAMPIDRKEIKEVQEPIYQVTMVFRGNTTGKIKFLLPREIGIQLTENLSMDELEDGAISEKEIVDSMKELVSILCGHFLTTFFDNMCVFNVETPVISNVTQREWLLTLQEKDFFYFSVDDIPIFFEFSDYR